MILVFVFLKLLNVIGWVVFGFWDLYWYLDVFVVLFMMFEFFDEFFFGNVVEVYLYRI